MKECSGRQEVQIDCLGQEIAHYYSGGPTRIRKKVIGKPLLLLVQAKGINAEFVVKTAFQSARLVEAWI
jgi:hypothetical protein